MLVSGVTIVRNAIRFSYPVVESITSILPLCDEFVVNVGISDDETMELIRSIDSPKMRIMESRWDERLRRGGLVLSQQTNRAMRSCHGDWLFYLQADEVIREKYLPRVKRAMERYLTDSRVLGLTFDYLHFYGSYRTYQDNRRRWYRRRTRVVRNLPRVRSWGDAMDFKTTDGGELRTRHTKAKVYHYGWVRPPGAMTSKRKAFEALYRPAAEWEKWAEESTVATEDELPLDDLGNLVWFRDTHPAVMTERVSSEDWSFDPQIEKQLPWVLRKVAIFLHPLTKRLRRWFGREKI